MVCLVRGRAGFASEKSRDGRFWARATGFGAGIATSLGRDVTFESMSEAMLSINNIAVQQQLVKEEARLLSLKSEGALMFSNYGALDLSNDDAQHPDSEQSNSPQNKVPPTFSGSVSRENSQVSVRYLYFYHHKFISNM